MRQFQGGPGESGFMIAAMGVDGKLVKGAPYSAQAITETTQVLADGTRISRKTTSSMARDSEGRSRREETISAIGPWASEGKSHVTVFINDPVAQTSYVLDSSNKSANKMSARRVEIRSQSGNGGDIAVTRDAHRARSEKHVADHQKDQQNVTTESLGNQTIAGVAAAGTRRTHTIPAGQIGNDRPISIVSETWYSDDLHMVVMSKHSDPRSGETTYTLANVQRAEPAASLFTVPADYTVQENSEHIFRNKVTR